MNKQLQFEVMKKLEEGDLGEDLGGGFRMTDIGGHQEAGKPSLVAPTQQRIKPKTREERAMLADSMATELMSWYMKPEVLNDPMTLNPIRDGIPQCRAHPFERGSSTKVGCVHGCGARERDGGGNLPVARDYTVGDVWQWVRLIVRHAIERQDKRLGQAFVPDLTPGR